MAKRRISRRLSKNTFIGSKFLNSDTDIIDEEETRWWDNLDENMSSQRFSILNTKNATQNDTLKQLSLNSQLDSDTNISEWWKHLESSDDQSSNLTKSRRNLSAVLKKTHVFMTTDSESEKESNLLKKKVLLRGRSRRSSNNAFLNALNDTENILTKGDSLEKISRRKTLVSDDQSSHLTKSGQNLSAVLKKTHLLETTDSGSEKEKKPNLLKKKVLLRGRSRRSSNNVFLNALNDTENTLTKNDSLKKISRRKTLMLEKKSSTPSMQNIDANKDHNDDQRKEIQLSQTLLLENNEAGPSNLLSSKEVFENTVASNKTANKTVESDESDIEINNHKRFKFKSYLMQRAQKSMENNNFEDVLAESNDINLSEYNQDKEIDIPDPKSSLTTNTSSSLRKSVNRSKQKIDSTYESAFLKSPIRRSPRSLNLSEHNQNKETDIPDPKSSLRTNLSSSRKSVNRSKRQIGSTYESVFLKSPILRSPRSLNLSEHNKNKETDISDPKSSLTTNSLSSPSKKSVNRSKQKIDVTYKSAFLKSSIHGSPGSLNLSQHNQNKETDIPNPKSSLTTNSLSSPSKRSVNRSKQKIDVTYESAFLKSSIRGSPRFLKTDETSTSNVRNLTTFQSIYAKKYEEIKAEVARDMAAMKMEEEKKAALKTENKKLLNALPKKQPRKEAKPAKVVNKAFLVNGKVWKPPPLPRPKHWATNHLYKFLWKRMEPKYQLSTRVRSEKFIVQLAKIVSYIQRCKKYESYKRELEALMKEMAHLNIINTRSEFHHFCQDFMPHEFRIKVIPMLLPGNKRNIPFEPEKLNIPLL